MDAMDTTTTNGMNYPNLPVDADPDEWIYTMRRTMQEIIPGLFLGPYAAATRNNLDGMLAAGLTHVVCIRSEIEAHLVRANHPNHFQYLILSMEDSLHESIIPKVKSVAVFIDDCFRNGGKVLVHGNAGMSRSAAIVIGYIMSSYGVTFNKASSYVQHKRFCTAVGEIFANQLREYEPIYKAMHNCCNRPPLPELDSFQHDGGFKRKMNDVTQEEENLENGLRQKADIAEMDTE